MTRTVLFSLLALSAVALLACPGMAQEEEHGEGVTSEVGASWGWVAVGAGLAVGLAGLGTGIAQSRIGAAGVAGIAEDRGLLGLVIMLVAIPESVLIFGFVIAYLLYTKM
jgi:V/A-type H+-transporting ATPase subunit K